MRGPGQVGGRALAGRLLRLVFGRAKDAQGFDWAAVAHGPRLLLGRGKKTAGSQGTRSGKAKRRLPFTLDSFLGDWSRPGFGLVPGRGKKEGRQSRDAERQSEATFTLYAGFFFARLDAGSVGRERQRAQAPTRALAGRPSTARARGRGRAWGGGETGGASCRAVIPPGWDGWLGRPP